LPILLTPVRRKLINYGTLYNLAWLFEQKYRWIENTTTYNNVLNSNMIQGDLYDATSISNVVDKIDLGTFALALVES
jgi:hypothetical protein